MMKEINAQTLEIVAGGTRKSDQLNQTLTQVQSSISSLAQNNNNNGSSSTTTMLMLAMAMQNRQQTVVAAPAAQTTVVAAPAFSFRARFRF
jgi:hypothetical protein